MIKKILKIVLAFMALGFTGVFGYIVYAINPWNVPAIFKRNYPEWFEAHPAISKLIKID